MREGNHAGAKVSAGKSKTKPEQIKYLLELATTQRLLIGDLYGQMYVNQANVRKVDEDPAAHSQRVLRYLAKSVEYGCNEAVVILRQLIAQAKITKDVPKEVLLLDMLLDTFHLCYQYIQSLTCLQSLIFPQDI